MNRAQRLLLSTLVAALACGDGTSSGRAEAARHFALGHAADSAHIAASDVDVGPDGMGLPPGSGSVTEGAAVYAKQCANCHGARGEGIAPAYPALVGRDSATENFAFTKDWKPPKTIGNYWPYATTLFDYVRRAMPHAAPGSLTNNEVYALSAWLLSANGVIGADRTLDATSLAAVKMPYASRFVRDNRRGGREVR